MGSPDTIRYEFLQLEHGALALQQAVAGAEGELSDLRGKLATILAEWEGSGDETYKEVKRIWDGAANEFQAIGGQIGRVVTEVGTEMRETEALVVKTVGSHHI
ncbi:WXG100 family type VII secretion target [Hamadaea tsunoensis]|uniref:WXG100 family type VII secretion target n=1 Tax=Hamadaea tsunoensis TaxID=53368 RepID=UPI0004143772|nr:WXG100 family type VII secretion target [Hamadaea tsunoensis]